MSEQSGVNNRLEQIDTDYQIAIIGGGIYGAALCWEAAHRGIKTLLIEQEDYASGASSNSLKTIHGGLRSLQSFNLPAVYKGIRERSIFLRIAPNYVKPLPCILPTTRSLSKSWPVVGIGLLLYNILCYLGSLFSTDAIKLPHARLLFGSEFLDRVPQIDSIRATGGALWYDAQVQNTERLVLQFVKSAIKRGAIALNHTIALNPIETDETSNGNRLLIRDQISGQEKTITASAIVDCTSAWNFIKQSWPISEPEENLTFLKSVNIIIRKKLFDAAVGINIQTVQSGNSRLYFFSPWRDCTMIGTWYSAVGHYPEHHFSHAEAGACIDEINAAFSQKLIDIDDICNVHIGFLPAKKNRHSDSTKLNQDLLSNYQFKDWSDRLGTHHVYSLRGTKYTLARHDAKQVIDTLAKAMEWKISSSQSDQLPIYQAAPKPSRAYSLADEIVTHLLTNYGADVDHLFRYIETNPESTEIIPGTQYHIMAEIYYVIGHEQALTLCDLLKRRLDIGDRAPPALNTVNYCAMIMQRLLSWSDETVREQITELYASYPEFLIGQRTSDPDNSRLVV